MKPWKLRATPLLVLILVLTSAGAVPGAIIEKGNQLINLVNPLSNNGSFAFTGMYIRNTNGDDVPFPGTDQVLVITMVYWTFRATDTSLDYQMQLNIGDYFRTGAKFVSGYASGRETAIPGIPITNFNSNIYVCKQDDPEYVAIQGNLSMRLVGYLAPNR